MQSEALETAVRSLRDPVEKFLQDGIFRHTCLWTTNKLGISDVQVRAIAREVARLHKRPFIVYKERYKWDEIGLATLDRVDIIIPKQRRLVGHVSALLLTDQSITGATIWECKGVHVDLWKKILHNWLTDPDLRAARKAPPL